jgi:hypothetical protein
MRASGLRVDGAVRLLTSTTRKPEQGLKTQSIKRCFELLQEQPEEVWSWFAKAWMQALWPWAVA